MKYLVTEDELKSATVNEDGELEFTRDNGEKVVAGVVKSDIPGPPGKDGANVLPTEQALAQAVDGLDLDGATPTGRNVLRASDEAAARDAIGAAAAGDEKTLVAGQNIRIVESGTSVTISALSGPTQGLMPSIPRALIKDKSIATGSGNLRLSYFTAHRSGNYSKARAWAGTTAAGATPSLVRFGLYQVADNWQLTLIASTANDTSLFASTDTAYEKSFSSTVSIVGGQRYALGVLIVTSAAAPSLHGLILPNSTESALDPRETGYVGGQTDLLSSISGVSVTATSANPYIALVP